MRCVEGTDSIRPIEAYEACRRWGNDLQRVEK